MDDPLGRSGRRYSVCGVDKAGDVFSLDTDNVEHADFMAERMRQGHPCVVFLDRETGIVEQHGEMSGG